MKGILTFLAIVASLALNAQVPDGLINEINNMSLSTLDIRVTPNLMFSSTGANVDIEDNKMFSSKAGRFFETNLIKHGKTGEEVHLSIRSKLRSDPRVDFDSDEVIYIHANEDRKAAKLLAVMKCKREDGEYVRCNYATEQICQEALTALNTRQRNTNQKEFESFHDLKENFMTCGNLLGQIQNAFCTDIKATAKKVSKEIGVNFNSMQPVGETVMQPEFTICTLGIRNFLAQQDYFSVINTCRYFETVKKRGLKFFKRKNTDSTRIIPEV
jgi:hypothetical protein